MAFSALLCLPKELRLLIFEHALADDSPVTIGLPSSVPWQGRPRAYHPPLTQVSSLTRQESLPIIYQDNTVVLVLRYREGRHQVEHWLNAVTANPTIRKHVRYASIQYFERPHRSTAMLIDLQKFEVLNRESWLHPLLGTPLTTLREAEAELQAANAEFVSAATNHHVPEILRGLIRVMTRPLSKSRLVLCESMANTRLHGYTDFQLRFEVIIIMYSNTD